MNTYPWLIEINYAGAITTHESRTEAEARIAYHGYLGEVERNTQVLSIRLKHNGSIVARWEAGMERRLKLMGGR